VRAGRHGVYARTATVAELDADLAVLAAVARRQRWRRRLGFPIAFCFRTYEARRLAYARAVLRSLDVAPDAEIALRLGLAHTQRSAFMVTGHGASAIYANPWLEVDVPLVSGEGLHLVRVEHLEYLVAQTGRRVQRQWTTSFEDRIELRFSAGHVAPPPGIEGDATTWRTTSRGDSWWAVGPVVPRGALDAVVTTLDAIDDLAARAAIRSPVVRTRAPGGEARVAIIGARGWALMLLPIAACAGLWAGVRAHDAGERSSDTNGRVWREAYASAAIALGALLLATCAWLLPPRAGRRR